MRFQTYRDEHRSRHFDLVGDHWSIDLVTVTAAGILIVGFVGALVSLWFAKRNASHRRPLSHCAARPLSSLARATVAPRASPQQPQGGGAYTGIFSYACAPVRGIKSAPIAFAVPSGAVPGVCGMRHRLRSRSP